MHLFFLHVPASVSPFPAQLYDSTCLLKTGLQTLPLRYKKTEGIFLHPGIPRLEGSLLGIVRLLEKDWGWRSCKPAGI